MSRHRPFFNRTMQLSAVVTACAVCLTLMGASRGAITKLTLNPDAPVVDLFDGVEQGQFSVRLIAQNANEGKIYITNTSDKMLTVSVPKGLVGVQVLAQPGGLNAGNIFGGPFGANAQNGQNGKPAAAQSVGGNAVPAGNNPGFPGFPGNNGNNGNNNNLQNGGGIFSIPPEKTVQIGLSSVCLNYGRRDPSAALKYQLVKAESVTTDPLLLQLLEDYSTSTNREVQQAAAWHLASGLTWEEIAQLKEERVPGSPTLLFTSQHVQSARTLVDQVKKNAAERPTKTNVVRSVVAK